VAPFLLSSYTADTENGLNEETENAKTTGSKIIETNMELSTLGKWLTNFREQKMSCMIPNHLLNLLFHDIIMQKM